MQIQKFGFFELISVSVIPGAVSFAINFCICNFVGGFLELFSVSVIFGRVPKINFCICNVRVHFPDLGLYM